MNLFCRFGFHAWRYDLTHGSGSPDRECRRCGRAQFWCSGEWFDYYRLPTVKGRRKKGAAPPGGEQLVMNLGCWPTKTNARAKISKSAELRESNRVALLIVSSFSGNGCGRRTLKTWFLRVALQFRRTGACRSSMHSEWPRAAMHHGPGLGDRLGTGKQLAAVPSRRAGLAMVRLNGQLLVFFPYE